MPMTKMILALTAAGGLLGSAAMGVPVMVPEAAQLPAPDVSGWRTDPVAQGLDPNAEREGVARFFAALAPAQQAGLAARFPAVVGSLDGAPIALRYAANASSGGRGRQFLLYDQSGDGRAIEVVGDLAAARRIVVLVPGSDTTLADFDRGYGGVERRAPAVQARTLYAAIGDPSVAVIAWLGYDPPEGLSKAAIREDRAVAGAAALTRFLDGLAVTRPSSSVVVIGHSYGTVVMGLTKLPPTVTDVVALASPGMGVDSAADLGPVRVWAARADADWIRFVPGVRVFGLGHSTDPTDPDFGATILPSDGVAGHDYYLTPGSPTLTAVAAVARGSGV
jgi:alpha/beta hydrolase family protein